MTIQALKGYEVTVRGETSVPRAELANLLFAAGAAVRVSRDAGVAAVEVHRVCDRKRIAARTHGQDSAPLGGARPGTARGRRPPDDGAAGPVPPRWFARVYPALLRAHASTGRRARGGGGRGAPPPLHWRPPQEA